VVAGVANLSIIDDSPPQQKLSASQLRSFQRLGHSVRGCRLEIAVTIAMRFADYTKVFDIHWAEPQIDFGPAQRGLFQNSVLLTSIPVVTRQERIDDFDHEGTPPADQPLQILCEDHVGTYVIPFLCQWRDGLWQSLAANRRIEAKVVGWRQPRQAQR
jgi:hypothetical protein